MVNAPFSDNKSDQKISQVYPSDTISRQVAISGSIQPQVQSSSFAHQQHRNNCKLDALKMYKQSYYSVPRKPGKKKAVQVVSDCHASVDSKEYSSIYAKIAQSNGELNGEALFKSRNIDEPLFFHNTNPGN